MKEWMPILMLSRYRLLVLVRALVITISISLGSYLVREYLQLKVTQTQSQIDSTQATMTEREKDLSDLQTNSAKYQEKKKQGLLGAPHRENWVEQLVASRKQLDLPDTLNYTLKPMKPVDNTTPPDLEVPVSLDPNNESPVYHDLDFQIGNIHEEELLRLISDYREHAIGRFRVQSCSLRDPRPDGLIAQCTLRFFNLPQPASQPAAGG